MTEGTLVAVSGMEGVHSQMEFNKTKPNYGGLDLLKFGAALLVVANHTGPLGSLSPEADFWFSNLLTRIAVPVFFLSAGFFYFRKLTGDRRSDNKAFKDYAIKIGKLYAIAILIYLPINAYKGDFDGPFTAYSVFRTIVFEGTFYHLWYLPALIVGLGIATLLHRSVSAKTMLIACGALYAVGLLGDAYYGIVRGHEAAEQIYGELFRAFGRTRNGLFFAPLYLALGARAAAKRRTKSRPAVLAALFVLSLGLMLTEGTLLRSEEFPRDIGMYAFAVPSAYFLFSWAMHWRVKTGKAFREWRVWIYILHPLAIILVHGGAEAVRLKALLVENSAVNFIAVCLLSLAMAAAVPPLSALPSRLRSKNR